MTLVASVVFILLVITVNGLATCVWMHSTDGSIEPDWYAPLKWITPGSFAFVLLSGFLTAVIGVFVTWIPLRSGIRNLDRLEP